MKGAIKRAPRVGFYVGLPTHLETLPTRIYLEMANLCAPARVTFGVRFWQKSLTVRTDTSRVRGATVSAAVLRFFNFQFEINQAELSHIQKQSVIIIANHPLGSLDGIGLLMPFFRSDLMQNCG